MTYLQALEAHKAETERVFAHNADVLEDWLAEDVTETYGWTEYEPENAESIAFMEQTLGVSLPAALRDLYLHQGGLKVFETTRHLSVFIPTIKELFEIRANHAFSDEWPNLYGALIAYGGRKQFDNKLSQQQIGVLKSHFFVFGIVNHCYENRTFLVFTRDGIIGKVRYEDDCTAQEWDAEFLPLCEGKIKAQSIDEMLEPQIRACTAELVEKMNEESW